jgi:hypothetical protein
LVEHCVVKWPWSRGTRYRPEKKINRAEFVKMLIKVMYIWQEYDVQSEEIAYAWDTYFVDIDKDFWWAQYIAKAYELGILDPLFRNGENTFEAYKSMTTKEIIDIIVEIDIGQWLAPEAIEELFSWREYPERWDIAMLLVTKRRSVFRDYLLLQWQNEDRLWDLLQQLKWNIILNNIVLL